MAGERAVSFGVEADSYHAARPGYPPRAVEHVFALTQVLRAVEVGAGTGKATGAFARTGVEITCLEPDPAMAAVLSGRDLPGVEVVVESFEGWAGPADPADLVFAAQAWHWLDRTTAGSRARGWLRSGGVIALMWNIPTDRYRRFETVYATHAPHILEEADSRVVLRDSTVWLDDLEGAGFDRVELATFEWSRILTSAEVRRLYLSYSDHIALDPAVRGSLLEALTEEVDRHGGTVDFGYHTRVFSGVRP